MDRATTRAPGQPEPGRRHPASLQQGQRRGGEDGHPERVGRVRARSSTPTASTGRPTRCGSRRGSASTTSSSAPEQGHAGQRRAARRQPPAEPACELSDRPPFPDLTSGFRARAAIPARVPAPAAQRLLDADHDDAGLHQGRIQRLVRADRGAAARQASPRFGWRRDGAQFLLILLKIDHDLQSDADLPAGERRRRSPSARPMALDHRSRSRTSRTPRSC